MTDNTYSLASPVQADLDAILRRCERATTAPWKVDVSENFGKDWPITTGSYSRDGKVYHVATDGIPGSYLNEGNAKEDAEFIAYARTDIPLLVAELREARSLLETISNSTEHADAAQTWECEKAELLDSLRDLLGEIRRFCEIVRLRHSYINAQKVIAKYEAK